MLLKLAKRHPDATRDDLKTMYLDKAKRKASLIDEAPRRTFDNDYASMQQPARQRRKVSPADLDAADQRLQTIILLDLVQPNGKKLRDCTGTECGGFSDLQIIRDRRR